MTDCDYYLFSGFYCRNNIIIVIYKIKKNLYPSILAVLIFSHSLPVLVFICV